LFLFLVIWNIGLKPTLFVELNLRAIDLEYQKPEFVSVKIAIDIGKKPV
jgi:hypothetical protein